MKISDELAVSFHYTLTNDQGEILDSSEGNDPLNYIHGSGMIIPGLEKELAGKSAGDIFNVSVEPAEAYGEKDDDLVQTISRDEFPPDQELEPGMQFHAQSEHGTQIITILEIGDDEISIDANHPLAGERLTFDIEVLEIREATEDEKIPGHLHDPHGDH